MVLYFEVLEHAVSCAHLDLGQSVWSYTPASVNMQFVCAKIGPQPDLSVQLRVQIRIAVRTCGSICRRHLTCGFMCRSGSQTQHVALYFDALEHAMLW